VQLLWQISDLVSSFYTLDCMRHGLSTQDSPIGVALAEPVVRLHAALETISVPENIFWSHLVPLAALYPSLQELADVTLRKTVGAERAFGHVEALAGLLHDAQIAFMAAIAKPRVDLMALAAPIKEAWNYHGAGLMGRAANWTDPDLVVDEATIILVHPARMGGGVAYLQYNLVTIEAVSTDLVPELPEFLRLAWLLSMLNLDLPRFSENIAGSRLPMVAGLAMVPVILTAAQELALATQNQETMSRAIQNWLPKGADHTGAVWEWWDGYTSMRPSWATALSALDRLLSE
jgi:hypothetical protein